MDVAASGAGTTNAFCAPLFNNYVNHTKTQRHFTKTGSGQTSEKSRRKSRRFFRAEFWLEGSGDYDLDFKTAENDGTVPDPLLPNPSICPYSSEGIPQFASAFGSIDETFLTFIIVLLIPSRSR
jgi:hypothetical protein